MSIEECHPYTAKDTQEIDAILEETVTSEEEAILKLVSGSVDGYAYNWQQISVILSAKKVTNDREVEQLAVKAIQKIRTAHTEWILSALQAMGRSIRETSR